MAFLRGIVKEGRREDDRYLNALKGRREEIMRRRIRCHPRESNNAKIVKRKVNWYGIYGGSCVRIAA
jgi:hypothetical protein